MHGYCQRKVALEELTARKNLFQKKKKKEFIPLLQSGRD